MAKSDMAKVIRDLVDERDRIYAEVEKLNETINFLALRFGEPAARAKPSARGARKPAATSKRTLSDETRKRISESMKKKHAQRKKSAAAAKQTNPRKASKAPASDAA
jgi:hypothetical protein